VTRCIGLDLSLSATGVCFGDGELRTLTPPSKDRDARLLWFYGQLRDLTAEDGIFVIESTAVYGHANGDTATLTGELHGIARLALRDRLKAWVAPASLKKLATGKGNATKPDMRAELLKRTGLDIRDDNQCDAYWLRAMGMAAYGDPVIDLPKSHTCAIGAVTWPGLE
jgi:Holliday junction resolvasome RuvABC endonuclease subunit